MIIIGNDNGNLFNNENDDDDDDDDGYHYFYNDSCVTIIWRSRFSQHMSKTALTRLGLILRNSRSWPARI